MIVELIGLPGAGKTTLARALERHGAVIVGMPGAGKLIFSGCWFALTHPFTSAHLLSFLYGAPSQMRYALFMNGYLGYAARYRTARRLAKSGKVAVLDQGYFHWLVSLGPLPERLVAAFPRPDTLVFVEAPGDLRQKRMEDRGRLPREELGFEERAGWERLAEESLTSSRSHLAQLVPVISYDGTRDPEQGALELLRRLQKRPAPQHVYFRRSAKMLILIVAYIVRTFARMFFRRPEVVVLMYHAVDQSGWKLSVDPRTFERHMQHLSRSGTAISLKDVVSYVRGERTFVRAAAVTFDDGYRDVLDTALPILERYGIPATVFVPSNMAVRTGPGDKPRLTESELRILSKSPLITIGSHAHSHRKFTELSPEEMEQECRESADRLARMTGAPIRWFAYPFGSRSEQAQRVVRDAGYEAAFGITEGTIHPGDNLFCVRRVQVDGTMSPLAFRLRLTGAVDWNRRIVDGVRAIISPWKSS